MEYIPKAEDTIEYLLKTVKAKDTVATLGAGSIYKIGEAFIKTTGGKGNKKVMAGKNEIKEALAQCNCRKDIV